MNYDCDTCQGEGVIEGSLPGGRFSMRDEQGYPEEETLVCPECNGARTLEQPSYTPLVMFGKAA
ncbi:MAG: hypothetical protein ACRCYY_03660 [Trueperaceae bacterium]